MDGKAPGRWQRQKITHGIYIKCHASRSCHVYMTFLLFLYEFQSCKRHYFCFCENNARMIISCFDWRMLFSKNKDSLNIRMAWEALWHIWFVIIKHLWEVYWNLMLPHNHQRCNFQLRLQRQKILKQSTVLFWEVRKVMHELPSTLYNSNKRIKIRTI